MRETGVETVWIPPDTPLLTLNILFWLNVFKTDNTSVPIPIVLPTEICSGIVVTYMSVVMPVVATFGTCWYIIVCAVLIPILCDPASPLIAVVLKPDITTLSWAFKLGAVPIYAATWVGSLQTKVASKVSTVVLIDSIGLPDTLLTETLNPPPLVSVLSNTAESPTS